MNRILGSLPLFVALCGGCKSDHTFPGATGVGNPGKGTQQLARGDELTLILAEVDTEAWLVEDCEGETERVEVDAVLDLLDPSPLVVPGGPWCGLALLWRPPLIVEGAAEDGEPGKGTFRLELQIEGPQLALSPSFLLDEHEVILEAAHPGWISKEDLGLEDGVELQIAAGHPLHDALRDRIDRGSALYVDADADGRIDPSERDQALASGPLHEDEDEEEDDD